MVHVKRRCLFHPLLVVIFYLFLVLMQILLFSTVIPSLGSHSVMDLIEIKSFGSALVVLT